MAWHGILLVLIKGAIICLLFGLAVTCALFLQDASEGRHFLIASMVRNLIMGSVFGALLGLLAQWARIRYDRYMVKRAQQWEGASRAAKDVWPPPPMR